MLEGLAGGRWALVSKTHHCMVDGVGSVDVGARAARRRARAAAARPGAPAGARRRTTHGAVLGRLPAARCRRCARRRGTGRATRPSSRDMLAPLARARRAARCATRSCAAPAHQPERARSARSGASTVVRVAARRPQGDQARARRHRQRRRARGGQPAACARCCCSAARTPPARACARWCPVNVRGGGRAAGAREPRSRRCSCTCRSTRRRRSCATRGRSTDAESLKSATRPIGGATLVELTGHRAAGAALVARPVAVRHPAVQRDDHERAGPADDAVRVRRAAASSRRAWCRSRRSTASASRS